MMRAPLAYVAFGVISLGMIVPSSAIGQTRPGIVQPIYRVGAAQQPRGLQFQQQGVQQSPSQFGGSAPTQFAQAPVQRPQAQFQQQPAQQPPAQQQRDPAERVAVTPETNLTPGAPTAKDAAREAHPLDPAIEIASRGLDQINRNIKDYTATLVKRERIDGVLSDNEFMFVKIRNRKVDSGRVITPFGVYMKFLKPRSKAGREVIYVEGSNSGKLLAHETPGLKNLITAKLPTDGYLAMLGNRYPITEAGVENLTAKLLEKGTHDRKYGECDVKFFKGAKINDRTCTLLQVTHPTPRPHFEFHIAQVFIDDELQVPIRYAAYSWPTTPGGKPVLEEEYTYMNLKLNVGLTEMDFSSKNPGYKFP